MPEIFNPNPTVFRTSGKSSLHQYTSDPNSLWLEEDDGQRIHIELDDDEVDPIDKDEIFGLIRFIKDPEHPGVNLEELRVVSAPQCRIAGNLVTIEFTPTVPHCGMSTLIGLSIRVRLLRSLPSRFKVDIFVKPGSHQSEHAVNKQLNDKERVAAALENPALVKTLEDCLDTSQ
ncbi:FAM96B protein [Marasmius fiardii PR-910]|nr:FAM96B protein [Marasmius fiardii PR-910]